MIALSWQLMTTGAFVGGGSLGYLIEDDLLRLARDGEQVHGTVRNAVGVAVHHLDAARQVVAMLETRDGS